MSQEASGLTEDRKKVFKRAFFMASGTLTSRILGLLRDMALGAFFDRTVTDAWTAAFRLPNLFRRVFGEGSLSVSFIPVFIQTQDEDQSQVRSKNLLNGFYTLLLMAVAVLTLLGFVFTDQIFHLLLSESYSVDVERWRLTLRLGRIMFGFIFFVCTYAYFTGILNSLGSFGLPAVAPALLNISMLVFTFMPESWFPQAGDGLAWGVLVGGILQALLLFCTLKFKGYLPHFQTKVWNADIKKVLINMVPGIIGLGLAQFSVLISLYYASSLAEGSISYIYWADRLLELPLSLVSVSLGTAMLPALSGLAAKKEMAAFKETARSGFLMNLFLAWPAALGLYFLSQPIVEVLFFRGKFTVVDVQNTTAILKIYALSLVAVSCSRVILPMYYAIKNTFLPAFGSIVSLLAQLLLAPLLVKNHGLQGLVIATLAATLINLLILILALPYQKLAMGWKSTMKPIVKFFIAGLGLVSVLKLYDVIIFYTQKGLQVPVLFLIIVLGVIVYFSIAATLRCEEFTKIRPLFRL